MSSTRDLEEAAAGCIVDSRYSVKREIARGGIASVVEAEHVVTRAHVALKTLIRPALDSAAAHLRLQREARVLGAIRHPNVVAIHDAGHCAKHGPYLALDLIEGRPLAGILVTRHTLPVPQAVAVVMQICDALETVHQHGIIHRDLKPANVLIARLPNGDRVELIDFGIAKVGPQDDVTAEKLTKMGELLGTVEYMAPEQIMGTTPVDARSDVYGVGVILYELLTGEVPFSGSATAVISQFLAGARPPSVRARRTDVPLQLEAAVRTALEVDPEKRFASPRALAQACADAIGGNVPPLSLLALRDDRGATPAQVIEPVTKADDSALRRRQYLRAPYVTPVRLELATGSVDGRTEDVSEGGALVVTDTECANGVQVKVRLPLPTSGRVVVIDAVTRWIKIHRTQRAIGLEFRGASDDVRAEIRAYVALMSGAPVEPPQV